LPSFACRYTDSTLADYRQQRKQFLSLTRPIVTVGRQKLTLRLDEFQ
jgi:hypothetical protein